MVPIHAAQHFKSDALAYPVYSLENLYPVHRCFFLIPTTNEYTSQRRFRGEEEAALLPFSQFCHFPIYLLLFFIHLLVHSICRPLFLSYSDPNSSFGKGEIEKEIQEKEVPIPTFSSFLPFHISVHTQGPFRAPFMC